MASLVVDVVPPLAPVVNVSAVVASTTHSPTKTTNLHYSNNSSNFSKTKSIESKVQKEDRSAPINSVQLSVSGKTKKTMKKINKSENENVKLPEKDSKTSAKLQALNRPKKSTSFQTFKQKNDISSIIMESTSPSDPELGKLSPLRVDTEASSEDVDLGACVGKTVFSAGFVADALACNPEWRKLVTSRHLRRVSVEHVSGIGFLSHIYRVRFRFTTGADSSGTSVRNGSENGTNENSASIRTPANSDANKMNNQSFPVILKVPSVANVSKANPRADAKFLHEFSFNLTERHNKELLFYTLFGHRIKHIHVAKVFAKRPVERPDRLEAGCLLMEDLAEHGQMGSALRSLTKNQIDALIRAIAEIHAISLSIPNSAQVIESFHWSYPLDQEGGQAKNAAVDGILQVGHKLFTKNEAFLQKIASKYEIMQFDSHKQFGLPAVLCHGDFYVNNIFFKKMPDGSLSDEPYAICDWQFAHPNSGLIDVARLILVGVDAALKRRHLDDWLRLYYRSLVANCRRYNVVCPYKSYDVVKKLFKFQYHSEMLFSFVILLSYYQRVDDPVLRETILERMVSTFEYALNLPIPGPILNGENGLKQQQRRRCVSTGASTVTRTGSKILSSLLGTGNAVSLSRKSSDKKEKAKNSVSKPKSPQRKNQSLNSEIARKVNNEVSLEHWQEQKHDKLAEENQPEQAQDKIDEESVFPTVDKISPFQLNGDQNLTNEGDSNKPFENKNE